MRTPIKVTAELVRDLFDYNPETGALTWKKNRGRGVVGKAAGWKNGQGYLSVILCRKRFKVHRLVWLWYYGEWPTFEIDHIDRTKTNNRIANLRDVTHRANMLNIAPRGESGIMGVQKHFHRYRARTFDPTLQKSIHIGSYKTAEEAKEAFRTKHQELYGIDSPYFDTHHKPHPAIVAYAKIFLKRRFEKRA